MDRLIVIHFGDVVVHGELNDSHTATLIWEALPIDGTANRWGDEIYFSIPVYSDLDDTAHDVVEKGDLGYWPHGHAFCMFFGPTPVSRGAEIRPASEVNLIGKIKGDLLVLKEVRDGIPLHLKKEQEVAL